VERSADAVERLQAEHPQEQFFQRDLDQDRLDLGRKFDRIFMLALIEHLFNQKFVMDHVADALKPGGCVVLTTPTPLGNDLVHRTGARLGLFARDAVDDHIVLYDRHRFRLLAREVGLELREHRYFQLFCNQIAVLEKPAG
jgi:2-polyprenyl-3-methyl-5-hydroxy-6-metoxy-1,4-benzoquinol methylase